MKDPMPASGSWDYEYLPFFTTDTHEEIPNFRIFTDDEHEGYIAETDENLPSGAQEKYAKLIAGAPDLYEALEYFFNIMHDYPSSMRKGYVKFAMQQARQALTRAKDGAA
jgi:hypothetical protein